MKQYKIVEILCAVLDLTENMCSVRNHNYWKEAFELHQKETMTIELVPGGFKISGGSFGAEIFVQNYAYKFHWWLDGNQDIEEIENECKAMELAVRVMSKLLKK